MDQEETAKPAATSGKNLSFQQAMDQVQEAIPLVGKHFTNLDVALCDMDDSFRAATGFPDIRTPGRVEACDYKREIVRNR